MGVRRKIAGLLAVVTLGSVAPLSGTLSSKTAAPRRYTIRGTTPACVGCSIDLVRLTTIGAEEGAEALLRNLVWVDQRTRTVTLNTDMQHVVFDSAGRRLALFGREGRGPGE
jgi:hypothetical protein